MASQVPKSSKPSKPTNQFSSHLAMIELKQRILTSLSKLSDRDTHQIAVEDLEKIIQTLSNDGVSMLLNCLYDATNDPKPAVKKESLRLLPTVCASHNDSAATHLTKIIACIVKKLKDSDSGVREACRDAIGSLSSMYLKGESDQSGVALFVKPLFEAMNENSKSVQSGAAMCMAKMVECASETPLLAFQKLCPRICKYLNNPNFMAKASLLPVVSSLSQVGAIAPQNLEPLLQTIHECLSNTDWATRKAAADTLSALALNSSNLVAGGATSTLTVLEASRFDKIKPVRDSMLEALQHWKKIAGKEDGATDDQKALSHAGESSESTGSSEKDLRNAVGILKKRAPALSDRKLNPEFFQKLEERSSGDLPVEVVVPRQCLNASNAPTEVESESDKAETGQRIMRKSQLDAGYSNTESQTSGVSGREHAVDEGDLNQRESSSYRAGFAKNSGPSEGFMANKGNWLAIQRQLLLLEKQQAHLTNMLQDFMGGSHGSMVALENRVRGLERVVEDMARDLSLSAGRRGGTTFTARFDESHNRPLGKYNSFHDYSSTKLGRGSEGSISFGERFVPSDGNSSGMRGRSPPGRLDNPDAWDFHAYGKNGQLGSRRGIGGGHMDARSSKPENEIDQVGTRRGWAKGAGPVRFGEGPSARSIWQASKDEATLEAIRVAGEDNGTARGARVAIPELEAEALTDDNVVRERDPVWNSWTNAMDAFSVGDMESAFSEVLSTGDDFLLVKLMDRSGPVIDQLSNEVASEALHAIAQFFMEPNLTDICLSWVQQLLDIVVENGPDVVDIPMEVKKELLFNLNEISSSVDMPEDWEGATPEQLLLQLASAWDIDLQELEK
ncbi:microtubule-associated protein TORTIFOLIA1-like [Nicotiana tomentosiformis]|uniref:microtubule-associated protein TORTIFOLIA1-like n=1 Tax=Nicotiana tomentosiformis TaxID=4098 RepID=UPI00051B1843|nr:microtubule-associated protein TORTIFOLIA1-like [Nicotiana tomentosiformis]